MATSTTECSKFESVCAIKRRLFFMSTVFCHDCFLSNPTGGIALFNSSKAANAGAEFMLFFPRMDNSPVHTTRVWTALRVRELPTLETDAFRVQTHSVSHTPVGPRFAALF